MDSMNPSPNKEILTKIIDEHYEDLIFAANRIVLDLEKSGDVVQEVCIHLLTKTKVMLAKKENPVGYVLMSVRNKAIDFQRNTLKQKFVDVTEFSDELSTPPEAILFETHDLFKVLLDYLTTVGNLSVDQIKILPWVIRGLKSEQIVEVTGMSLVEVRRLRNSLMTRLKRLGKKLDRSNLLKI